MPTLELIAQIESLEAELTQLRGLLEETIFGADHMDAAITRMNARLDSPRYLVHAQGVYRAKRAGSPKPK